MAKLNPTTIQTARRALMGRDPVLGALIKRVGPCSLRPAGDPYGSLLKSILHQQLAGAAARTIEGRFREHFGGRFPKPTELLATRDASLRALGLSRQKAAAVKSVALALEEGRVRPRRLWRMEDEAVVENLTQIKGVGEWTAHMILMFSLGRPDVLPVGDYGVRKGVQLLYGLDDLPKPDRLQAIAAPWQPYRTVASWYVWRHLDESPPEPREKS